MSSLVIALLLIQSLTAGNHITLEFCNSRRYIGLLSNLHLSYFQQKKIKLIVVGKNVTIRSKEKTDLQL